MRVFLRVVVTSAICLAAARPAGAQESDKASWPLEVVERPLTLAAGMAEIGGDTLRIGVSSGDAFDTGEPILLAPELRYGLSSQLQLGVTHSNHSFFPPAGICISGEENKCPKLYNAIGLELEYAISRGGSVDLSARAGATTGRFDPDFALGATAGLEIRFRGGRVALVLDPNVYIGIIERDTFPFGMAENSHPDYLFVPATVQFQLGRQMMVFAASGLNTPLKDMGDFYQIPAGLGTTYAINDRMDAGLELQFANVAGKDFGTVEKLDERNLILRLALRL